MGSFENFLVCHVNCQSLVPHLDEFKFFFGQQHFHAICMSETWLHPGISDDFVALPGYQLVRRDRLGKAGGGVGIFVTNSLKVKMIASSEGQYCNQPEFLVVEISSEAERL